MMSWLGTPDQPHERRGDYAQYKLEGQALRLTVRNLYNPVVQSGITPYHTFRNIIR